jgi:hypothetical protein
MARQRFRVHSFALLCGVVAAGHIRAPDVRADDARELASRILDDSQDREARARLVEEHPEHAVALLREMVRDLQPGTKEEYRRIPWIWRVAIAAGRRNDEQELRRVLEASLPTADGPLHDWQAVVIGGGVINGISQRGAWPGERVAAILKDQPELQARWRRSLELASSMADDEKIPMGTRYDALRMVGLEPWQRRGTQLSRYLKKGTHDELQMGAVSALGDMRSPEASAALLSGIRHYSERNRELALDALMRSRDRRRALRQAVTEGRVDAAWVGEKRSALLRDDDEGLSRDKNE